MSLRFSAGSQATASMSPGTNEREENRMALKRYKGAPGTFIVLEHTSAILQGNPLHDPHEMSRARSARAQARRLAAAAVRRYEGALSGAVRPRRIHRLGPRACEL